MRFPKWALAESQNKAKYLLSLAAMEIGPTATMSDLAHAAKIPYPTMLWAYNNRVSAAVAEKVCNAVPGLKIKPHWLTNPEWIETDEVSGEII
nr:hypothetical protein [Providencia rettgeri]